MTTDYTPGDEPVPVGTIVEGKHGERCEIVEHQQPEKHPYRQDLPRDLSAFYPDDTAYVLWPVRVPKKFGNRGYSALWVRRTSFRIIEPPREGTT